MTSSSIAAAPMLTGSFPTNVPNGSSNSQREVTVSSIRFPSNVQVSAPAHSIANSMSSSQIDKVAAAQNIDPKVLAAAMQILASNQAVQLPATSTQREIQLPDGSKYLGEVNSFGQPHGKGQMFYSSYPSHPGRK